MITAQIQIRSQGNNWRRNSMLAKNQEKKVCKNEISSGCSKIYINLFLRTQNEKQRGCNSNNVCANISK